MSARTPPTDSSSSSSSAAINPGDFTDCVPSASSVANTRSGTLSNFHWALSVMRIAPETFQVLPGEKPNKEKKGGRS